MSTTYETIVVERRGEVEWITLNRPSVLNALNGTLVTELADRLQALRRDTTARVVVLRGAGRAFCAGLDIKAQVAGEAEGLERLAEIVVNIGRCPQPVIAAVHGAACGGGFALALAADIRIAGESARMNDAFITLGVSGCELGLTYHLPRHVGTSVAAELMYTGRFIDARRALQVGLVSSVVPDIELEAAVSNIAHDMLRTAPLALRKTKEVFRAACDIPDIRKVMEMEYEAQAQCMQDASFSEGLKAFIERREPRFSESS